MKILYLRAYYEPEITAATHLVRDLNDSFVENSFTCVNYTPMPTRGVSDETRRAYKRKKTEILNGGQIVVERFSMIREGKNVIQRAFRYLLVNVVQYTKGTRAKGIDVLMSGSTPPTQGALCGLIKRRLSKRYKKNVPFVYVLDDVFPDSLVNAGMTRRGSFIWKIGRRIEDYTYRSADRIIVISESMKRNIMEKGVKEEKISVISNWIDVETTVPVSKDQNRLYEEFGISKEKFTVLYAGNFGAAQGADVVLHTAELLKNDPRLQFVIFGGGAEFDDACKYVESAQLQNVIVNGLLPQERISEVYSLGDVALITCKKGVGNSGMPSKTWSIMACNTPIIASFDTDSDLAEVLKTANAGICVDPESPEMLKAAILEVMEKDRSHYCGGRDYVCANAAKDVCVSRYIDILKDVVK